MGITFTGGIKAPIGSYGVGDYIGVKWDSTNVYFYKNGSLVFTAAYGYGSSVDFSLILRDSNNSMKIRSGTDMIHHGSY